jgi:LacI family transcriptional regulator
MAKGPNKKIGVKDIALRAGVSIGTVDRVLHNRGEVKKETRDNILSIVDELGYQPNVLARSLASKKTTRIGIVIPDSSDNNPYWEKPVLGIKKATEELTSYNIEIIYEYFDASSIDSYAAVLEKVCQEDLDGVVLNPVFKSTSLHYISIFNTRNIPYVFIDINIKGVGKLAYFGQDAEQSGKVAAKLMSLSLPPKSNILIVKQSNKKVFSQHIESRVFGFHEFLNEQEENKRLSTFTLEIDLLDTNEPHFSLAQAFTEHSPIDGVFVPNSRAFKVAEFLEKKNHKDIICLGYDLVEKNLEHLEKGSVTYLINQQPEEQAFKAIMALFDHLIAKKAVRKTYFSPIDIILKENIDYDKETKQQ